ncbi:hypothetical protein [Actinomadura violacea]|uniref:Uncharacterized protein n=1 Tax=Actinomadura violacea TaxID=2819934 RepID=A0ABS3RSV4_9ACTN|nr:hypothetical protein [Actinomadura violacea]MBO2459840.1 hypothetical protein [Actinomadura violacea]
MPFTIVCHHHTDDRIGRAAEHWDDRDGAAKALSTKVEEVARVAGLSEAHIRDTVAETAETGRFVILGLITWVIADIDRPDQEITEFADRARQLVLEAACHDPALILASEDSHP